MLFPWVFPWGMAAVEAEPEPEAPEFTGSHHVITVVRPERRPSTPSFGGGGGSGLRDGVRPFREPEPVEEAVPDEVVEAPAVEPDTEPDTERIRREVTARIAEVEADRREREAVQRAEAARLRELREADARADAIAETREAAVDFRVAVDELVGELDREAERRRQEMEEAFLIAMLLEESEY